MKNLSLKNRSNYFTKQTFHCHMLYLSRTISAKRSNTYEHLHTLQLIVQNYVISVFCLFVCVFAQQYFQNLNDWRTHWNKSKVMYPDLLDIMGNPPSMEIKSSLSGLTKQHQWNMISKSITRDRTTQTAIHKARNEKRPFELGFCRYIRREREIIIHNVVI